MAGMIITKDGVIHGKPEGIHELMELATIAATQERLIDKIYKELKQSEFDDDSFDKLSDAIGITEAKEILHEGIKDFLKSAIKNSICKNMAEIFTTSIPRFEMEGIAKTAMQEVLDEYLGPEKKYWEE